ncbi:LolA family protein [Kordiimonas pumila]|uniref:Outer membrane lipoprotein carrier protein LolA n=1 Tax=Kordiimonas pumila TaxID=2161677 RepID=A0ABV7DAL3_9PROT|nr:outer membrane lipoprotein carrier protein LolA [Kordiimonas pumila]
MKAPLLCLLFVFAAPHIRADDTAKLSPQPLEEQTIEESSSLAALTRMQTYMEVVQSLEADFVQEAPDGSKTRGTLYMARPGKIRFDYADDVPFLMVADGKTLNFIDYEIGQVTKWPVKDTPLRALLGKSTDLASINAHIQVAPEGVENLVALSASDPDKPEMGRITVYFENAPDLPGGLKLLSWVVIDAQEKVTIVELSRQSVNVDLKSDLWSFEDPRGLTKRRTNRH